MTKPSDVEFYRTRIDQERERARLAADERIARIHTEMAERYEQRLAKAIADQGSDAA